MLREEAIKELQESLDTLREYDIAHSSKLKQALEMAIRTLENHDIFMKRAYSQGKQDALSQEPNGYVNIAKDLIDDEEDSIFYQEPCTDAVSRDAAIKAVDAHTNEDGTLDDDISVILEDLPPLNPQYTGNEFFNFDAPMVKKSMEQDAISREAVLNLCTNDSYKIPYEYEDDKGIHRGYDEYRLINYYKLKLLSPVTPQPSEHFIDGVHAMGYREGYKDAQKQKSGKWLITPMSNIAYCSKCNHLFKDIPASMVEHFKYCPSCGACMREGRTLDEFIEDSKESEVNNG